MIELVFTGMCKGCEVGDLSLEPAYYDSYGETRVLQWSVVCSHRQACERQAKMDLDESTMGQLKPIEPVNEVYTIKAENVGADRESEYKP